METSECFELLTTYDSNYKNVEKCALNTILSCEISVFNGLRDITLQNIISALNRLEKWFGVKRSLEHCICLTVLTEYISCAYCGNTLYKTFENAMSEKLVDTLFFKLCSEWEKIFRAKLFHKYAYSLYQSVRCILRISFTKFPNTFRHKNMLEKILRLIDTYDFNLKEEPVHHHFSIVSNRINSTLTNVNTFTSISNDNDESMKVPCMNTDNDNENDQIMHLTKKENIIPEHYKNNALIREDNSLNFTEINKIPNFVPSDEKSVKMVTFQNSDCKSTNEVLNAFDILMRKHTILKRKKTL